MGLREKRIEARARIEAARRRIVSIAAEFQRQGTDTAPLAEPLLWIVEALAALDELDRPATPRTARRRAKARRRTGRRV